jgi:hypothetical protein
MSRIELAETIILRKGVVPMDEQPEIVDAPWLEVMFGTRTNYYMFTGGKWIYTYDGNVNCIETRQSLPAKVYIEIPLPQPPQDPFTLLTGFGRRDITGGGSCAGSFNEAVKFERIGD